MRSVDHLSEFFILTLLTISYVVDYIFRTYTFGSTRTVAVEGQLSSVNPSPRSVHSVRSIGRTSLRELVSPGSGWPIQLKSTPFDHIFIHILQKTRLTQILRTDFSQCQWHRQPNSNSVKILEHPEVSLEKSHIVILCLKPASVVTY
jgi:hypothetical protein